MLDLKRLLTDVFNPQKGENIILFNDFPIDESNIDGDFIERRNMTELWHKAFEELSREKGFSVEPIIIYSPTWGHNTPLPETGVQSGREINLKDKVNSLGPKDIVLAITRFSATGPICDKIKSQNFRFASMPMVDMSMSAFNADYKKIAKKAKVLTNKLNKARGVIVTFSTGHEIYFDLRDRSSLVDDGDCSTPGRVINLPSGEVYIAPLEGQVSKTKGYIPVYSEGHLVIYEIEENKIIDVITSSPQSEKMRKYFRDDPARANIAEFGLGCNDQATFINNLIQDEKVEGMHWSYGYNDYMGGKIRITDFKDPLSAIHVNIIYTKEARIKVRQIMLTYPDKSREVIMENSRYSFNILKEFEN
jgi:hypothetical protein